MSPRQLLALSAPFLLPESLKGSSGSWVLLATSGLPSCAPSALQLRRPLMLKTGDPGSKTPWRSPSTHTHEIPLCSNPD